jgi:hypothetical protein
MPRVAIQDQFSHIPSKQRRWQLRREAEGGCRLCSERAFKWGYCLHHAQKQAEFTRDTVKMRKIRTIVDELDRARQAKADLQERESLL